MTSENAPSRSAGASSSNLAAPGSPESYIGSLISLTSKSEIRYEGVLYNINTEESSIGLRNVRSFGTEGRKQDGQQIPASDRVYEYILFRGGDIKDLLVKSSPPAPSTSVPNDPAIIQSHYVQPDSVSSGYRPPSGNVANSNTYPSHLGNQVLSFTGNLPPYQPNGDVGSWRAAAAPQPPAAGSLSVPQMYWHGFYQPSSHPHLQQLPLLRPPSGVALPTSLQQPLHYPQLNASVSVGPDKVSDIVPPVLQPIGSNVAPSTSVLPTMPQSTSASISSTRSVEGLASNSAPLFSSVPSLGVNLPSTAAAQRSPVISNVELSSTLPSSVPYASSNKATSSTIYPVASQSVSQTSPSGAVAYSPAQIPLSSPVVTSSQIVQSEPVIVSSSQSVQVPPRKKQPVEGVSLGETQAKVVKPLYHESSGPFEESKPGATRQKATKPSFPESSRHSQTDYKWPILPLPRQYHSKPNGVPYSNHHNIRSQGRGRGNGYSRPITKFTEDFDFTAMNEKFNKDEVWGSLGKLRDNGGEPGYGEDDDDLHNEDEPMQIKPVYVKDDFFDSLSCDRGAHDGRSRFSERLKMDTETFGNFPTHRPAQGRGWGFRGGGRAPPRGAYRGRGYGGVGRGSQVHPHPNRASY